MNLPYFLKFFQKTYIKFAFNQIFLLPLYSNGGV